MQLGQPDSFNVTDTPAQIAQKLENTFSSMWRNFTLLEQKFISEKTVKDINDHTTEMPDLGGVNQDHDKRYYTKSQLNTFGRNNIEIGHRHYNLYEPAYTTAVVSVDSTKNIDLGKTIFIDYDTSLATKLSGLTDRTVVISANITISSNITFASGIKFRFQAGGKFTIGSGVVVSNLEIENDPMHQIISCAVADTPVIKNSVSRPEWFGAVADNSTVCTNAIQSALNCLPAVGGSVLFSSGYYRSGTITFAYARNYIKFIGTSHGSSWIMYTGTTGDMFVFTISAGNYECDNLNLIDLLFVAESTGSSGWLFNFNGTATYPLRDLLISHCNVANFANGINIRGGINTKITGGRFSGRSAWNGSIWTHESGTYGVKAGDISTGYGANFFIIDTLYCTAYETCVYNYNANPLILIGCTIGTAVTALKNGGGRVTYAHGTYYDSYTDNKYVNDGYLYDFGHVASSLGTQLETTNTHRLRKIAQNIVRTRAYISVPSQTLPVSTAVPIEIDTAEEDTEGNFLQLYIIPYDTLAGGTFAVGDTVTNTTETGTGTVKWDNGSTRMFIQLLTGDFVNEDDFNNGAGVSAKVNGSKSSYLRFVAGAQGFYKISSLIQFRCGQASSNYNLYIYVNAAKIAEDIEYKGLVNYPFYFSKSITAEKWLTKNDFVELYASHTEALPASVINGSSGIDKSFIEIHHL